MKNKKLTIIFYFIFLFTFFEAESSEQFNFDVKEIEILEKGNRYVGKNKGTITTDSGVIIDADKFEYLKTLTLS